VFRRPDDVGEEGGGEHPIALCARGCL
jgi:hypothetical protein